MLSKSKCALFSSKILSSFIFLKDSRVLYFYQGFKGALHISRVLRGLILSRVQGCFIYLKGSKGFTFIKASRGIYLSQGF